MVDIKQWTADITERLQATFGKRLLFVGLQGSYARGEATEASDIDLVVVLDSVGANDLAAYAHLLDGMPAREKACGFFGSIDALRAWPRFDLFQLINDTVPIYSTLEDIPAELGSADAAQAACNGASVIYHTACHACVFADDEAADEILKDLFKSAFFTLQAIQYVRGGIFFKSKVLLADVLDGDEARILEISRDWEAFRPHDAAERRHLAELLMTWAQDTMESLADEC